MNKSLYIIFVLSIYLYLTTNKTIRLNIISMMVILRGILAQSRLWWTIHDIFISDSSGANLYLEYKMAEDFTPLNLFGRKLYMVHKYENIKYILDNSPVLYGVGEMKMNFFRSFMSKNVGVSNLPEWSGRRALNEKVLDSDSIHRNVVFYNNIIKHVLKENKFRTYSDFEDAGKYISLKIVFNEDSEQDYIFDVFGEANSLLQFFTKDGTNKETLDKYNKYLMKNILNPKEDSLVKIGRMNEYDKQELIHQIPHWIFPINGAISIAVPRFLCIILQQPKVLEKLKKEILSINQDDPFKIYTLRYLRKCILEFFRLMNPVNSSFRTLVKDHKGFKKGDQFIIFNNSIMRDPYYYIQPNEFIPERWTRAKEKEYYAIQFNQGPQKCPGKELVIFLIQSFIVHFFYTHNVKSVLPKIGKTIPQTINPFKIIFN